MFVNKHCTYSGVHISESERYFNVITFRTLFLFKDKNVSRFSGPHQCTFKLYLLQGSNQKNKGNRNQSYGGNLHILTFFSFEEQAKLINQMTDFYTVEIPNFGVFAIFMKLSNLSARETFPNQKSQCFSNRFIKIFYASKQSQWIEIDHLQQKLKKILLPVSAGGSSFLPAWITVVLLGLNNTSFIVTVSCLGPNFK